MRFTLATPSPQAPMTVPPTEPEADPAGDRPASRAGWGTWVTAVLGTAVALAVFAWMGRSIVEHWDDLRPHLARFHAGNLALAVVPFLLFALGMGLCYAHSLRLAGARVGTAAAASVYLGSQLAKYLPGKVLYVAGQIGLAKRLHISVSRSLLGFTVSQLVITAAAVLVASPLLGAAIGKAAAAGSVVVVLAGLAVLASGAWVGPLNAMQRRRGKPELGAFTPSRTLLAVALGAAGWACYALFAIAVTRVMMPGLTPLDSLRVGAAAVAAWLVGFLSFITPAGAGVREGVFVVLLRGVTSEPAAIALALVLRVLDTILQLGIALAALAYSFRIARAAERRG